MAHWRSFMDSELLFHYDLPPDRDVIVTIDRVDGGKVTGTGGKSSKKPMLYFRGKKKPLALNATNGKTIERIAGTPDISKWGGIHVALYVTTTQWGGETVPCIRVRPTAAKAPAQSASEEGTNDGAR